MSKFEELRKAYATTRSNYFDYRRVCLDFATRLFDGMTNYFQCPEEQLKYHPLEGERLPNIVYTLTREMRLGDDSFWHLKIGLTLYEALNIFPHETVLLPLLIKKLDTYFIVKFGPNGEEFKIRDNNPDDFNIFYEFIFKQIKEDYEKGLQRFLEQNKTSREIGF